MWKLILLFIIVCFVISYMEFRDKIRIEKLRTPPNKKGDP